jgi:hypothetical protein
MLPDERRDGMRRRRKPGSRSKDPPRKIDQVRRADRSTATQTTGGLPFETSSWRASPKFRNQKEGPRP